jgi:hypothetical protein
MSLPEYPLTLAVFEREYPDFWEILRESSERHIPDFRAFWESLGESYPLNIGILGLFRYQIVIKTTPLSLRSKLAVDLLLLLARWLEKRRRKWLQVTGE